MRGLGRIRCDEYLGDGFFLNRFWLLGSHEINTAIKGHRQVFPFAGTIDGGRTKPGPPINSYLPEFFQVEASRRRCSIFIPD